MTDKLRKQNLIALDLGTNFGLAGGDPNEPLVDYYVNIELGQNSKFTEDSFFIFDRLIRALFSTEDFMDTEVTIVWERPSSRPYWNTLRVHHGLQGILESNAAKLKNMMLSDPINKGLVHLLTIPPTTIKKFWTGTGKADKDFMVEQTQRLYPKVTDDNASDAIALWHYTQEVLGCYLKP